MYKIVTILSCTLFFILGCKNDDDSIISSPPITTQFTGTVSSLANYGGSKNDSYTSVVATTDGGYIVTGYTQSIDGDITDKTVEEFDYWVVKYASDDTLQWSKTFGGSQDDRANQIIQTNDGGYALIGYSKSNDLDVIGNQGQKDFWMLKLDASGSISWQKDFGFSGNDKGITLIQTIDGGYLLGGIIDVTASGGAGNDKVNQIQHAGGDYWAIKLDANGTKQWRHYYGGGQTETLNDVIQTTDGGFLLIGDSDSNDVDVNNNKGSYDFWVVKISNTGQLQWEKSYGGTEIEKGYHITQTNGGDYIIVGDARSTDGDLTNSKGNADVWAIKINDSGTILWQKNYGGTGFDSARDIVKGNNGNFFITGSSRSLNVDVSTNNGQNDVWIIKIDDSGNLIWQKSLGGSQIDIGYGIAQLQDGSLVVAGDTTSDDFDFPNNKGFKDALIVKIQ